MPKDIRTFDVDSPEELADFAQSLTDNQKAHIIKQFMDEHTHAGLEAITFRRLHAFNCLALEVARELDVNQIQTMSRLVNITTKLV